MPPPCECKRGQLLKAGSHSGLSLCKITHNNILTFLWVLPQSMTLGHDFSSFLLSPSFRVREREREREREGVMELELRSQILKFLPISKLSDSQADVPAMYQETYFIFGALCPSKSGTNISGLLNEHIVNIS